MKIKKSFSTGIFILILIAVIGFGLLKINSPSSATTPTRQVTQQSQTGEVKEFDMIAKQWEFQPSTITVNKGDTVKLNIKSIDVAHGFALPDFGIDEYLSPGNTVNVKFVADKTGTFTFYCSVSCGAGHGNMRGKLVVRK